MYVPLALSFLLQSEQWPYDIVNIFKMPHSIKTLIQRNLRHQV